MPHSTKEKWDEWYRKNKGRRNQTWVAWYHKNKERIAAKKDAQRKAKPEQHKAYQDRSKKTRRQALAKYKLEKGCAICGYQGHPDALHFDHLPGSDKKGNVGYMYRAAWADVVAEIAKCQVLCANCHAVETAARRRDAKQAKKQEREKAEQQLRLHLG